MAADFQDRVPQPPVKLLIPDAGSRRRTSVALAARDHDFTARIGTAGRAHAAGMLATRPFAIDWKVDLNGVELLPLRPYFEATTNVIFTGGAIDAKGRVTATGASSGSATGFAGDVTIRDFGALDRPTSQELVRWKALSLAGVDVATEPRKAALGAVGLDQFYARIIVNPDATLNLKRLLSPPAAAAARPGFRCATSTPASARSDPGRRATLTGSGGIDRRHQVEPRRSAIFGLLHQAELFGAPDRSLRQRVRTLCHAGRKGRGCRTRREHRARRGP
jgi:hypothetical protein